MDLKDTVLRALNELVKNGGEGSGDFNHAGNPPHVGGSEPVGSRHARGFKSKSERKEVKDITKEEEKEAFKSKDGNEIKDAKYKGCDVSIIPDGKYSDIRIYAPEGKTFPNGDTFYTTQALTEKAEEHAKRIIDGITERNEWRDTKPSGGKKVKNLVKDKVKNSLYNHKFIEY